MQSSCVLTSRSPSSIVTAINTLPRSQGFRLLLQTGNVHVVWICVDDVLCLDLDAAWMLQIGVKTVASFLAMIESVQASCLASHHASARPPAAELPLTRVPLGGKGGRPVRHSGVVMRVPAEFLTAATDGPCPCSLEGILRGKRSGGLSSKRSDSSGKRASCPQLRIDHPQHLTTSP